MFESRENDKQGSSPAGAGRARGAGVGRAAVVAKQLLCRCDPDQLHLRSPPWSVPWQHWRGELMGTLRAGV